ncbi:TIR domain-containing protein [Nitrosomonas sp.]|uniref:TIR domain-containing protein n=1 Tax=Nitrosomonas sp. TaxID=42353 RepID=UPI0025CF369A|nr:TIR domain-containing protein [Nitrosomonas sp.]
MTKLFISHSSQDDAFVRELREVLADHGQAGWIDSRELRGGDLLWPEIQKAIEDASAYAVVVSPNGLQSDWVGDELAYALDVQKQRGEDEYPVIPLSLDGTKLGILKQLFATEPLYISVSSEAGGIEAAMDAVLVALKRRSPADVSSTPQPKAEPLEELVLELTDLKIQEQDGKRRASARARLIYEPATPGQREVISAQQWRFVAPIGPIEVEELRWYLEKYAIWPSHYFRDQARKVEENLVKWGQLLHEEAMPAASTANVMLAWVRINDRAGRRFSIHVDATPESGAPEVEVFAAREAATLLLGLPWELLHDGDGYLFQGAKPTRVRRRLPNTKVLDVPVVAPPIRILLVTARPEDEACGYIDHRASALPLVDAMESLPGLVLQVLNPPTLPSLRAELDRGRGENKPYHVVHFDGHGVYDRSVGLGGLCFELPEDSNKLEQRRHATVFTSELGPLLRDHRIPLVFLGACQTAKAEQASESVASELLKTGVVSVIAMSHSVLVETAQRFVSAFYQALAGGKRVGDAMLAGQRQLKDDTFRRRIFGAGELRLEDWFVPVLFQEKDDPQLFKTMPAKQTQEDAKAALAKRLGDLPPMPETGFVGRSRELLALQRLLQHERYAVVRGQGGEGKTALAAELARWMVRSQQIRHAAFVSVETHSHAAAVLDALGRQLVCSNYSVATFENLDKAMLPIERALRERATLLIVDNMESILLSPFMQHETPEALSEDANEALQAILALCEQLLKAGDTRLIFTSREALPEPFNAVRNRRELHQLDRDDAVKLVERVLNVAGGEADATSDATREEIEQLVDAVHCHARTLSLLAPALRSRGVEATRVSLVELMAEMEKRFPGSREQSVFASIELSLQRLSAVNQEKVRVLGVFHSGFHPEVLRTMMQWEVVDVVSLAKELIQTGLATANRYNYLTLNPALCPYLLGRMEEMERESLMAHWVKAMLAHTGFLRQQQKQKIEVAATLTMLELPNLFVLLDRVQHAGDAAATIDLTISLYDLLRWLDKPRLLGRVGQVRDAAATALGDIWNHLQFEVERTIIEQQLAANRLREAFDGAQALLQRAREAGEQAYPGVDYDLAMAHFLLARVLHMVGDAEQALPLLNEAHQRFDAIEKREPDRSAAVMVSACIGEQGTCFLYLGRLEEAAEAYEKAMFRDEKIGIDREVVVSKGQLATVRLLQRRYPEVLKAYAELREKFTQLNEPHMIAVSWHQTGNAYQEMNQPEAAENAYYEALAIDVRLGDVSGQADTLMQLGSLYGNVLGSLEKAVDFYRQAAEKYAEIGNVVNEGRARNNLGDTLRKLNCFNEARLEINRAIACCLDYRRDGGKDHSDTARLALGVSQSLLAGDNAAATSLLHQQASHFEEAGFGGFIHALQAIVAGNRDPALADAPDLHYTMAAEILFLIETLEKPR